MITWMQRHKKWLITTIWVSTIAFVGAGFVGWGSYDFGKSQGAVAVVGDKEVKFTAFQNEYNNVYNQYARMFGDQFNQEMAEKLNLQDVALNQVVQKYLLLNYAEQLGLEATQKEVAKQLVQINAFTKDGQFDKDTYIKVLSQNRTKPAEFEAQLKQDLTIQKVQQLFTVQTPSTELEEMSKLLTMSDNIDIKVINAATLSVEAKPEDVKAYWEKNKNNYMSQTSYELNITEMPITLLTPSDAEIEQFYTERKLDYKHEDGRIKTLDEARETIIFDLSAKEVKKDALRLQLKLKKEEEKFATTVKYLDTEFPFASEDIETIKAEKEGTVLKPFLHDNKYIIAQIAKINKPQPLSFEQAQVMAQQDYKSEEKQNLLKTKAQEELKNFTGMNIGFVNRSSIYSIPGLNAQEAQQFLNQLFSSTSKEDVVMLATKAVVFKINESKMGDTSLAMDQNFKNSIQSLKENQLLTNLLEKLRTQYEVYTYKEN